MNSRLFRTAVYCGVFFLTLAAGCARRGLTPEEQARLEAQEAISRAENRIKEAKELGGDVALPESLVTEARDLFKKSDYLESKKKADEAYELADRMLKEIMKTREELRRMAELEKDKAFPLTYVVQPWETSKDCLWNIAKKKNIYDDPWKWKKIYMANKEQIKDPDLIYTGQVLKISR